MNAPRCMPRSSLHRIKCASDRKATIVDQVYVTLSQNWRGGTAKWTMPSRLTPPVTDRSIPWLQWGHLHRQSVSRSGIAEIPIASHAQLAQYEMPPLWTVYGVGTAQNGCVIQMDRVLGERTMV